jgi:hypothetical protein
MARRQWPRGLLSARPLLITNADCVAGYFIGPFEVIDAPGTSSTRFQALRVALLRLSATVRAAHFNVAIY